MTRNVVERVRDTGAVDADEVGETALRVLFGDHHGATLFAVALVWFGLVWRFGFLSNDQYTVANTLVAVADGHLHLDRAVYGPASGATPGTHVVDGRVYGRHRPRRRREAVPPSGVHPHPSVPGRSA